MPLVHAATGSELFFSEYVEGSSYNKAIEIYNPTDVPISLNASGYTVDFYYNGNSSSTFGIAPVGTIQAGGTFVITSTNADAALLAKADYSLGTSWFNGDDAVVLNHNGTAIDIIGQIGNRSRKLLGHR